MKDITAIVVSHNTRSLLESAYNSVRRFHSDMLMIIVDGSTPTDPCYSYALSLQSPLTTAVVCGYNIGHGRGMDLALRRCKTKYALIFDSDIVMHESPVEEMLKMMEDDTYGVGYIEITGGDGFEYGAKPNHKLEEATKYLHPFFQLIQLSQYLKYPPYVHHGAPCYMAMNGIKRAGLSDKILKEFPGLGHSSGQGWNWKGEPRRYIEHHTRGTRDVRIKQHKPEIEGGWIYESGNTRTGLLDKRFRGGRL